MPEAVVCFPMAEALVPVALQPLYCTCAWERQAHPKKKVRSVVGIVFFMIRRVAALSQSDVLEHGGLAQARFMEG